MRLPVFQIGWLEPKNKELLIVLADYVWCMENRSLPIRYHVK